MFWKNDFMAKMRSVWAENIDKFQYEISGQWVDAAINSKVIDNDTIRLIVQLPGTDAVTITGARILDADGTVIGESAENITNSGGKGLISQWEFPVYEK